MASRILTIVLLGLVAGSVVLTPRIKDQRLPGNQQGYEPPQPLAFSHRQHAGDLQISCAYCHFAAEKSQHAGLPSASLCMNCHRFVTATWDATFAEYLKSLRVNKPPRPVVSAELAKLFDSLGLNSQLQQNPAKRPMPIPWVKVHNLPAYVRFDHRAHVHAGVKCQRCHGEVEKMDKVRQVEDLSMGWCVDCHREPEQMDAASQPLQPSTDCAVCHF